MITLLATRYPRKMAMFLFALFYMQLTLPVVANAFGPRYPERYFFKSFPSGDIPGFDKGVPNGELFKTRHDQEGAKHRPQFKPQGKRPSIGGPGQPEMSSFKSVNANDMVDLFTGDFSYNIPLMDVGGYPVNIHYSSALSMDQEASWVGLGWNINPGTISRSMRGLPDDFDGTDTITKTQHVKESRTVGASIGADAEIAGTPLGIGANLGVFHNTYNGWGGESSVNVSITVGDKSSGSLTAGLGVSGNSQNGVNISPSLSIKMNNEDASSNARAVSFGLSTNYNTRAGISALQLNGGFRLQNTMAQNQESNYMTNVPLATITFATPSYTPTISMPFTATNYSFRAKIGGEATIFHPAPLVVEGYVSKQEIKPEDQTQKIPAVGYLYYSKADKKNNVLLDFNREKELSFNASSTPNIAIPQYTYDVYSISGEGTGGMFRPYRGDVGYVHDYNISTKSKSDRFSVDLGFGNLFHGGVDFSYTNSWTQNNSWEGSNLINSKIAFRQADTTYQPVYFRNPGERTSNTNAYYQSIGDDDMMRVDIKGDQKNDQAYAANSFVLYKNGNKKGDLPVSANLVKKERDKRSQVISYLNAYEASIYGLDKGIPNYAPNAIPVGPCTAPPVFLPRFDNKIRKVHHLSEVTVLNNDGRRYVYGIPAYNLEQKDVTFSVNYNLSDQENIKKGLVHYDPNDDSTSNQKGKEGLFTRESIPAYAHSFLLSGILSPDYVDIKGDGITDDDLGDAVKFNYSRIYNPDTPFVWRTPYSADTRVANFNEGLKSYSRDDKATYLFGKKEVWYLNSIVSKTMIAVFKVSDGRKDVYSSVGKDGGIDYSKPLKKLDSIQLFSKADLIKNGPAARPVKTVHFEYSYSLCKGFAGDPNQGKMTLDSIWFSYNGNMKGKQNPYIFRYHPDSASYNPSYNARNYDRWGNFKDAVNNPGGLSNVDYPYAEQNKVIADRNAAAWTLDDIQLPSGGKIKVRYEADDYAFVQNKRATKFFKIAGVNKDASSPDKYLFSSDSHAPEYDYVFIDAPEALSGRDDIYQKFLQGNDYIYFKLAVKMKHDQWGSGNEMVPVYAQVEDYGLLPGGKRFWLKLKEVGNKSPLANFAVQFMRLNLPSRAYPLSEPGDDVNAWDVIKMIGLSLNEIKDATKGFEHNARKAGLAMEIDTTSSFVRLNCPDYRKLGGGHRVKRIEIYDNWKAMTGQTESVYGQEYQYTTSEKINGRDLLISSGVASYEPMIGGEENPFHQPVPYQEKLAPMAPANNLYSEMPLGESYFPSAAVGYSKVRVRTINAKVKSANGWQETEFYTTKDFPTLVENTLLQDGDARKVYNPKLSSLLRINHKSHVTVSQGFRIELNDMNGKVKAQASYAETDSLYPISHVRNYYKVDNDTAYQQHLNNTVWVVDSLNGHIDMNGQVGKDIEIMQDMREQTSTTTSNNLGVNADFFAAGIFPIIVPSSIPLPQREETRFRSAATVKIIQRYGILDSVVAVDKGSIVTTKNLLYDAETGEVVLSRTNNEFNDPVYNFSYPAHWAYSGMDAAYKNIDAVFTNLKLIKGKLYYGGGSTQPFPMERFFESGDLLKVKGVVKRPQIYNCLQFEVDLLGGIFQKPESPLPNKAWVIDGTKAWQKTKGLFVINEDGAPITGRVDTLRVLRSGKRNMLDASAGSIVSMANPIQQINGSYRLTFDSTTRIINTSAVTYKDQWKTENNVYAKDTVYKVYQDQGSVTLYPKITLKRLDASSEGTTQVDNASSIVASYEYLPYNFCYGSRNLYMQSILTFDFSSIPAGSIINYAYISLQPGKPIDAWSQKSTGGWCGRFKGLNWHTPADYFHDSTTAYLERINGAWNYNTDYNTIKNKAIPTNRLTLNSFTYSGIECHNLVQDLFNNNQSLLFRIAKDNHSSNNYTLNYLSFCGKDAIGTGAGCFFHPGSNDTCNCTKPQLVVYYKALVDSAVTLCKNYIKDSVVNPYRWGILGNWRVDRAYTYYHDRKESDASVTSTDIRKEGELKSFSTFWKFTDSALIASPDTTKWVWNSASSLYNKKGFEIENYDPLGRYNAGLYGYNQSLPTAVAQNSRYNEILFDGFEDYGYQSDACVKCQTPREFDFVKNQTGVRIDSSQSHTGRNSIRIAPNSESKMDLVPGNPPAGDSLSFNIVASTFYDTTIVGKGWGLTATYSGYPSTLCSFLPVGARSTLDSLVQGPVSYYWGITAPFSNMCRNWYNVSWKGKIQVPYTDNYNFYSTSDYNSMVFVNGVKVAEQLTANKEGGGMSLALQAGKLYDVEIRYSHTLAYNANISFRWSRSGDPSKVVVPQQFLYRYGATASDTTGSLVTTNPRTCYQVDAPYTKNIMRPFFNTVKGAKYIISAWVKIDSNNCNTAPALDSILTVTLKNGLGTVTTAKLNRTGNRIEGWQRYELITANTPNALQFKFSAKAPSDRAIYVDDIRIQPFNSSMKGYVYDPATLRLMAELDENNYATFYEYDDDGTLIRVKKETERGVMTIKETRSALVKN